MNWCQGDGFLSASTRTGTIKLAMARIGGTDG